MRRFALDIVVPDESPVFIIGCCGEDRPEQSWPMVLDGSRVVGGRAKTDWSLQRESTGEVGWSAAHTATTVGAEAASMRPHPGADADMYDAFTSWRFHLNWRAGERKAIKRRAD